MALLRRLTAAVSWIFSLQFVQWKELAPRGPSFSLWLEISSSRFSQIFMKSRMRLCCKSCIIQLQDERLSVIDRDNRLLASKLTDIVCSKGLVDHRNQYHLRR